MCVYILRQSDRSQLLSSPGELFSLSPVWHLFVQQSQLPTSCLAALSLSSVASLFEQCVQLCSSLDTASASVPFHPLFSSTASPFWCWTSQLSIVAGTVSTLITKVDRTFNIRACSQHVLQNVHVAHAKLIDAKQELQAIYGMTYEIYRKFTESELHKTTI